jgi:hypothetical protein
MAKLFYDVVMSGAKLWVRNLSHAAITVNFTSAFRELFETTTLVGTVRNFRVP